MDTETRKALLWNIQHRAKLVSTVPARMFDNFNDDAIVELDHRLESASDAIKRGFTMHYHAGWNVCGYLPETRPETFRTFDDARDYIREELEHVADSADMVADESDSARQQARDARIAEIDLAYHPVDSHGEAWDTMVEFVCYWIEPCEDAECERFCDDDDGCGDIECPSCGPEMARARQA